MAVCGFLFTAAKGNKIDRLRQGTLHEIPEYPAGIIRNMGILYQDVFGKHTGIHRNGQEVPAWIYRRDLSVFWSFYIRYLPGIFWDWFKGAIFAKNL